MYYDNEVMPQNDKVAFQWFYKAAEQGHAAAQTIVGSMNYTVQAEA